MRKIVSIVWILILLFSLFPLEEYGEVSADSGTGSIDRSCEMAKAEIEAARSFISNATEHGINVSEAENLLKKAQIEYNTGNCDSAENYANQSMKKAKDEVRMYAVNVIVGAINYTNTTKSHGINPKAAIDLIQEAIDELNSGKYIKAVEDGRAALRVCDETIQEARRANETMNKTASILRELSSMGIGCPTATKLLQGAREGYQKADYKRAEELASKALEKAKECNQSGRIALNAINSAEAAIHNAENMGLNPKKARELLDKAKSALASGLFEEAKKLAEKAKDAANDVDGDGVPNWEDFAPTINNFYIYGGAGILVLLSVILLWKLIRRRRLNSVYFSIVNAYKSVDDGIIPDEAEDEVNRMKELVNKAVDAYKAGNIGELQRIREEIDGLRSSVEAKIREYDELKEEIIRSIEAIFGEGGEVNAEH